MGDPSGVGPLISQLAWRALHKHRDQAFFVIGALNLYRDVPTAQIFSAAEAFAAFPAALPVWPLAGVPDIVPGRKEPAAAASIIKSIETAVTLVQTGIACGLVTNPINKSLLYGAGFAFPGHTEFLSHLCAMDGSAPEPVMMLTGGGLRVALATIHMPLAATPAAIADGRLTRIGRIVHEALIRDFGIDSPRIAFAGLNPHAGEGGNLGREEIEIINPSAYELRASGINISDARPADTVFAETLAGAYDAVIAMTHDQGLIPVKTIDFWGGVNITLGLPVTRTSPDHGTAYDAAAAGTARADSLIAAIRTAAELSRRRRSVLPT